MDNSNNFILNTNECNYIIDLFSPALGGELESEESGAFYQHLEACPRCRTEFDRWKDISIRLKTIPDVAVPPDFTMNVMAGIAKTRKRSPGFSGIFIRRGAAAAAAGILLLAGSMGSYGLFKTFNNSNQLAAGKQVPPAAHQQYKEPAASPTAGADDNSNGAASNSNNGNNTKPDGNGKTIAGSKQPAAGNASGTARTGGQAGQNNGTAAISPTALLSEKVVINSRLIKIQSGNAEYVAENANALLGNYKANVQNMVNQTDNGRTTIIMRIVTEKQKAGEIAGNLAGLGTVLESSTESKDITVQYQQALARQQELAALVDTVEGKEKQNYQNELDALNRQIREWNEAAAGMTIMFWVESK